MKTHDRQKQSGNALFMILIAIFLLGAITALFSRTGGQTEETGQTERMTIAATELLRHIGAIQSAVSRMVANGVSENEISLANTMHLDCGGNPHTGPGHNPNCTRPDCEVFHPQGGGIKPVRTHPALTVAGACMTYESGSIHINSKNILDVGTPANDLVLEVYSISREACLTLNRILGIENPGGEPPVDEDGPYVTFAGSFNNAPGIIGDEAAILRGKRNFCHQRPGDRYFFEAVLIAR